MAILMLGEGMVTRMAANIKKTKDKSMAMGANKTKARRRSAFITIMGTLTLQYLDLPCS